MDDAEFRARLTQLQAERPKGTHLYGSGQHVVCIHCAGISDMSTIVVEDPKVEDGFVYTGGPDSYIQRLSDEEEVEWLAICAKEGYNPCECGPV